MQLIALARKVPATATVGRLSTGTFWRGRLSMVTTMWRMMLSGMQVMRDRGIRRRLAPSASMHRLVAVAQRRHRTLRCRIAAGRSGTGCSIAGSDGGGGCGLRRDRHGRQMRMAAMKVERDAHPGDEHDRSNHNHRLVDHRLPCAWRALRHSRANAQKKQRTLSPSANRLLGRCFGGGLTALRHAHLQFVPTIVDDEGVERPERIHADHDRGLARELPLLENIHVGKGHAGVAI